MPSPSCSLGLGISHSLDLPYAEEATQEQKDLPYESGPIKEL